MTYFYKFFGILLINTFVYSLTITDSIKEVVNTHPQIISKQIELEKVKSQRASALGKFLPTLNASIKYNQVHDQTTEDGITSITYPGKENGIQLDREIIANWNIFNGFSDAYEVSSKNEQLLSVYEDYLVTKNEIMLNYIKSYIEIAKEKELYLLSQKKLKKYKSLYQKEITKDRVGLSSLSFVSNIKGKFRSTQIELYEKQRQLSDRTAQIRQFYKVKEDEVYFFPNLKKKIPKNIDKAIDFMMKNNHKLKKLTYEINISQKKYRSRYKHMLPTFTLIAKKVWTHNYYDDPSKSIEKVYLGAEAKINIFSGFIDWNTYISEIEIYDTKIVDKKKTIIDSIYKLKLKYNQLKLEESKDELLKYFIKARYNALTGTKYDFEFGKIDISIFLNSISEFYGAREKYLNHKYDALLLKYEFYALLGTLNDVISKKENIINETIVLDDERFFKKSDVSKKVTVKANTTYVVKKQNTTIYASNSKKSKIIGKLNYYDEIKSINIKNRWIQIKDGWVHSDNLIEKYLKNRRYIALKNVNARLQSLVNQDNARGWFKKGDELYSLDVKEGWIKTHKGWVYGDNLKIDIKADEYYIVNATSLLIRAKPSLSSKVIGRYSDMNEVYSLQEKDGWIETSRGWVNKNFLIRVKENKYE